MCRSNSLEIVEGVSVVVLSRNTRKKIPWCQRAKKEFARHVVRHRLSLSSGDRCYKTYKFDELLKEINLDFAVTTTVFSTVVWPKVQSALKYLIEKLWYLGGIYYDDEGYEGFQPWLDWCFEDSWDGDLKALAEMGQWYQEIGQDEADDDDDDDGYHSNSTYEPVWDANGSIPARRKAGLSLGYLKEKGYPARSPQAPTNISSHRPVYSRSDAFGSTQTAPAGRTNSSPTKPSPFRPSASPKPLIEGLNASRHNRNAKARNSGRPHNTNVPRSTLFSDSASPDTLSQSSAASDLTAEMPTSARSSTSPGEVAAARVPEEIYDELAKHYAELALIEYCLDARKLGEQLPKFIGFSNEPNMLESIADDMQARSRILLDELEASTWNPHNRSFGTRGRERGREKLEAAFQARVLGELVQIRSTTTV